MFKSLKRLRSLITGTIISFLVSISPLGIVAPGILLFQSGACYGAIGSGMGCHFSFAGNYIASVMGIWELSCIVLFCIMWGFSALVSWITFIVFFIALIIFLLRKYIRQKTSGGSNEPPMDS